jgi:hypothetical protein
MPLNERKREENIKNWFLYKKKKIVIIMHAFPSKKFENNGKTQSRKNSTFLPCQTQINRGKNGERDK